MSRNSEDDAELLCTDPATVFYSVAHTGMILLRTYVMFDDPNQAHGVDTAR